MGVVRAKESGLLGQARVCDQVAAELVAPPPTNSSPSHQATAAAVAQGHALIESTAKTLAQRAVATGAKLRSAAARYTGADDGSAGKIAAVGRSVEV